MCYFIVTHGMHGRTHGWLNIRQGEQIPSEYSWKVAPVGRFCPFVVESARASQASFPVQVMTPPRLGSPREYMRWCADLFTKKDKNHVALPTKLVRRTPVEANKMSRLAPRKDRRDESSRNRQQQFFHVSHHPEVKHHARETARLNTRKKHARNRRFSGKARSSPPR